MALKGWLAAACVALAGGLAWQAWHGDGLPQLPGGGAVPAVSSADGARARKCLSGAEVSYTNGPCPAGSREMPIGRGTVTVVPATPLPSRPAVPGASGIGNARDLLLEPARPGEQDQKERRIDAIVNR